MTAPSPKGVEYTTTATVRSHDPLSLLSLNVVNVVPSIDMDRAPYTAVRLELTDVDEQTWKALDPRVTSIPPSSGDLRFRVEQYSTDGVLQGSVPEGEGTASLHIREATRDPATGEATVIAGGGETMLADKIRNAGTTINTGATTVNELVLWSLNDVFGGYVYGNDAIVAATAIPAGDRRLMLQGQNHWDLLEAELAAINCRLYDEWGLRFNALDRDTTPGGHAGELVQLGAYTTDDFDILPADADPIITRTQERVTREGDWADGILVKGDYDNASGTRVTWYQASGAGANTKGRVLNQERPQPAGNIANQIVNRARLRGQEFTVEARNRFDVLPGMSLQAFYRGGVQLTGIIRGVEWDIAAGTMTIRAMTGTPV